MSLPAARRHPCYSIVEIFFCRKAVVSGHEITSLDTEGIRVVYKLIRTETKMLVVVVGVREDEEVYEIAQRRRIKYDL